jgi:hypothetical protein
VVHNRSFNQEVKSCQAPPRSGDALWADGPGDVPLLWCWVRLDYAWFWFDTTGSSGIREAESRQGPNAPQVGAEQINICFFEEISSIDLLMMLPERRRAPMACGKAGKTRPGNASTRHDIGGLSKALPKVPPRWSERRSRGDAAGFVPCHLLQPSVGEPCQKRTPAFAGVPVSSIGSAVARRPEASVPDQNVRLQLSM